MPMTRTQVGDDVVYQFAGTVDRYDIHALFDDNYHNYQTIGDALGYIYDFSQTDKIALSTVRVTQMRLSTTPANRPIAVISNNTKTFTTLLRTVETFTSLRGRPLYGVVTSIDEGHTWLANYFTNQGLQRDQLRGRHTLTLSPPLNIQRPD